MVNQTLNLNFNKYWNGNLFYRVSYGLGFYIGFKLTKPAIH